MGEHLPEQRAAISQLNEHFARFLQHADGLLADWRSAVDQQSELLAERVSREVDSQLDRSLADGLHNLRVEVERLARAAAQLPAVTGANSEQAEVVRRRRLTTGLLVSANLLLVVLVVLVARVPTAAQFESPGPSGAPVVATTVESVDAGVADAMSLAVAADAGGGPLESACQAVAVGRSEQAVREFVRATSAAHCGDRAAAVVEVVIDLLQKPAKKSRRRPATRRSKGANKRVKSSK